MMRRHELDPVSLTFGFAFTSLGLLFLTNRADQALRLRWIWPVLLLVLGAGILLDLTRGRGRTDPSPGAAELDPTPAAEPDAPEAHADPEAERAVDKRQHRI